MIATRSRDGRRDRTRYFRGSGVDFVPKFTQDIAAVGKEMAIGGENFQRDCPIVAALLQRAKVSNEVQIAAAERKMQIDRPTLVVVQMDVAQPRTVRFDDLAGRVFLDH